MTVEQKIDEINDIITKHFRQMFPELDDYKIASGSDFEVILNVEDFIPVLYWTPVVPSKSATSFIDFCSHVNPAITADPFLLCFFHEIGHIQTLDNIFDNLSYSLVFNELRDKTGDDYLHYLAPIEYEATYWGLRYMEAHPAEVSAMWAELKPKFEELNSMIEGDD